MDRKTENQLRQEIAEVFDSRCNYASFAGRVCNKCGRIHDGGKSVPVVGEPTDAAYKWMIANGVEPMTSLHKLGER